MRLALSWDVQVFPMQERKGPQSILQRVGVGTIPLHRLGRKVKVRKG